MTLIYLSTHAHTHIEVYFGTTEITIRNLRYANLFKNDTLYFPIINILQIT